LLDFFHFIIRAAIIDIFAISLPFSLIGHSADADAITPPAPHYSMMLMPLHWLSLRFRFDAFFVAFAAIIFDYACFSAYFATC
jgi:hypothetical protein